MFYRLKENYLLRGWEKLPNVLVDADTKQVIFISALEMDALKLCDGTVNLSLTVIPKKIRDVIPMLEKKGIIEPCPPGEANSPQQAYKKYPSKYIRSVHWSITGKCNYRCKHCYMSAPNGKLGELDHETVIEIINQLSDCGVMNVSLTGGEPLVREDFMEIVDAFSAKNIRITAIYSNGKLVSDSLLDALSERGMRPIFNMSYDGEGYHDWLRGIPGAEKIVEKAFLLCKEKGFPTGAEMCIHDGNKHTLRKSVQNLAAWGCGSLKTNPISNIGTWKEGGYGRSIKTEELYQIYLDYIPQYYKDGMPLLIQLGGFFSASPTTPNEYEIPMIKNCEDPAKSFICGHARMEMYISAEGRALPCMALSGMDIRQEFPLIQKVGLLKCLTDSAYLRLIETRASDYLKQNPECAACEHSYKCLGGCRAAALECMPNNIMGRDPYACELFRGGWDLKVVETLKAIKPDAKCRSVL